MPGSLITITRPSTSSRRARSFSGANSDLISPAATMPATRADISSSVRRGGVGNHHRMVSSPSEGAVEAGYIPRPWRAA
jgi:hypothetical protein